MASCALRKLGGLTHHVGHLANEGLVVLVNLEGEILLGPHEMDLLLDPLKLLVWRGQMGGKEVR